MISKLKSNLKKKFYSGGFTLTELLAYVTMSSLLFTGIGIVLNDIVTQSAENQKETLREQETNKALDLIAEEIRAAEKISTNPTRPSELNKLSETSDKIENSNPILVLEDVANLSSPIVYEIANLNDTSPWQEPMAIYRWGPSMNSDGNYANPESPSDWQSNLLIDSIESNVAEEDTRPDYCNINNPMNPYDEVVQIPEEDPKGFYICVPNDTDDDQTPSKMAQVVIRGRITNITNNPKETYQAQQKVSPRNDSCDLF